MYECGDAPDFDDKCWTEKKFTMGMPFPNLPYIVEGDFKLTQSLAILRYLASKLGLAGSSPQESAVLDMVADQLNDWRDPLYCECLILNTDAGEPGCLCNHISSQILLLHAESLKVK